MQKNIWNPGGETLDQAMNQFFWDDIFGKVSLNPFKVLTYNDRLKHFSNSNLIQFIQIILN